MAWYQWPDGSIQPIPPPGSQVGGGGDAGFDPGSYGGGGFLPGTGPSTGTGITGSAPGPGDWGWEWPSGDVWGAGGGGINVGFPPYYAGTIEDPNPRGPGPTPPASQGPSTGYNPSTPDPNQPASPNPSEGEPATPQPSTGQPGWSVDVNGVPDSQLPDLTAPGQAPEQDQSMTPWNGIDGNYGLGLPNFSITHSEPAPSGLPQDTGIPEAPSVDSSGMPSFSATGTGYQDPLGQTRPQVDSSGPSTGYNPIDTQGPYYQGNLSPTNPQTFTGNLPPGMTTGFTGQNPSPSSPQIPSIPPVIPPLSGGTSSLPKGQYSGDYPNYVDQTLLQTGQLPPPKPRPGFGSQFAGSTSSPSSGSSGF